MSKLFMRNGYLYTKEKVAWHRIVCEQAHGFIPKGWHVHHIDGVKLNNEAYNLIAVPERMHVNIHKCDPLPGRQEISYWLQTDEIRLDRKAVRKQNKKKEQLKLLRRAEREKKRLRYAPKKKLTEEEKKQRLETVQSFLEQSPEKVRVFRPADKQPEIFYRKNRSKYRKCMINRKHSPKVIIRKKPKTVDPDTVLSQSLDN